MTINMRVCLVLGLLFLYAPVRAQPPKPGKNAPTIRGQVQEVYFYPGQDRARQAKRTVLFVSGDAGMWGASITFAKTIATWGYDVYGVDAKTYLSSFTSNKGALSEADVMSDFASFARWMRRDKAEPVTMVGFSEGAGLCLLAAVSDSNKQVFDGVITISLSEETVLGWRWQDDITYLTKGTPNEPAFQSLPYMARVAPLPLMMIQASHDVYVSEKVGRSLFNAAKMPKRFELIEADNHRFSNNRNGFYQALRDGLGWVKDPRP